MSAQEFQPVFDNFLLKNRRVFLFPDGQTYDHIIEIMKQPLEKPKLKSREKSTNDENADGISAVQKQRIKLSFELGQRDGREILLSRAHNGKVVLKQSWFLKQFEEFHLKVGHPGRDGTIAKFLAAYAYVPKQLIEQCIKICQICQNRRSHTNPPAGKPITAKGL